MRARTVKEGSVGLFILVGLAAIGALTIFVRGAGVRGDRLRFTIFFANVSRLGVGAPVRFRGLEVGKVNRLVPVENGINVDVVVAPGDLAIPLDADFTVNQSGLIGESSVDIYMAGTYSEAPLPQPLERTCDDTDRDTICPGDRVEGFIGSSIDFFLRDATRLAADVSRTDLFAKIADAAESFEIAADELAVLSKDLSGLSKDISGITGAIESELQTLTAAVDRTSAQVGDATERIEALVASVNGIVDENRDEIVTIVTNVREASAQLSLVLADLTPAVETISDTIINADTDRLVADLTAATANAAAATESLKVFSESLNDSSNIALLQETLGSARATFANAEKITADLDELTGDPELRRNLRQLVEGLSDLVSSAEELERQINVARSQQRPVTEFPQP